MRSMTAWALAGSLLGIACVSPAAAEALEELAKRTHFHGIAVNSAGSAALVVATHHGVYAIERSGDVIAASPVQDFMGFSPDPANPLGYHASGHPAAGGNLGVIHSTDGGSTWKQVSQGGNGPVDFHQMDVSLADPKTIYGVYGSMQLSRDGGMTWTDAGTPPGGLIAISASSISADGVYAATKTGLFSSNDSGTTWTALQFAGEPVSMVKTGPAGVLYAFVVGRGVFAAREQEPDRWSLLAGDFGSKVLLHLAVDPRNADSLFATTVESEVLESADGGKTWQVFGAK
jgi:photosystem II stability/assembly factor-like uncharacterized protein